MYLHTGIRKVSVSVSKRGGVAAAPDSRATRMSFVIKPWAKNHQDPLGLGRHKKLSIIRLWL